MTKLESEKTIRYLCGKWGQLNGVRKPLSGQLGFYDFYSWVQAEHSGVLAFRSRLPTVDQVEIWFDSEFGSTWRN